MGYRRSPFLGGAFLLALGVAGVAAACADSEPPDVPGYGPPNGLATKTPDQPSTGGGDAGTVAVVTGDGGEGGTVVVSPAYACVTAGGAIVDAGPCAVSWKTNIYPAMMSGGAYNCQNATGCHGTSTVPPLLTGDEHGLYTALANYTGINSLPYISPCSTDPAKSTFACNILPTGNANLCGALSMPSGLPIADAGMINTWIACGAPEN